MPTDNSSFLTPKGDYKNLIAFQKSECIYDITYYFIEHYLPQIGDRTVDQMKQAARSGKQNIAEGNETGTTSMEACIKLVNVAKASLKELQEDYEDYLLKKLLERFKAEFLEHGGIKEQMSAARRNWREEHGMGYLNGKDWKKWE